MRSSFSYWAVGSVVAAIVALIVIASGKHGRTSGLELHLPANSEDGAIRMTPASHFIEAAAMPPPLPSGNKSSTSDVLLKLILARTEPGPTPFEGLAQIGVVRESPQTYQAGALLGNGARLTEIHDKFVVLKRDGKEVRLYLEGSVTEKLATANAATMVGTTNQTVVPPVVVSSEVLTQYVRPSPVYDGDRLVGYQVYPGAKSAAFALLGLQPGDVIVQVAGQPLQEPESAIAILNQLTQGAELSAMIKRRDAILTIRLDGKVLIRDQESLLGSVNAAVPNPEANN